MEDRRGRRVAFVAHCLLNQNAKAAGLAGWAAMVKPIIDVLNEAEVGVVQLPCPEYEFYGLNRPKGEDTKEQYECPEYRATCSQLCRRIVDQMKRYLDEGYEVACVLGMEGSPSCSVLTVPTREGAAPGSGIFFETLLSELRLTGIEAPVIGIPETADLCETVRKLRRILGAGPRPCPPAAPTLGS